MMKKIPLMVNEKYKEELENSAKVTLEKIEILKKLTSENLNISLETFDEVNEFLKNFNEETDIYNVDKQDKLLFIKFDKEVSKLMEDYPSLISKKALEMFCTEADREKAKEVINITVSINNSLLKLKSHNVELEHFILNDEFQYNSKIDSRLKESYTFFCKTKKQVELKELAEKLSEIVKHSIKIGLISSSAIGINTENIIDINTGKVKYNKIAIIE